MTNFNNVPTHIGIIMDGNGRWAKLRGLPRKMGHKEGSNTFKKISKYCRKIGVKYLTVYAFSTENWKRPKDEVDSIMNLLRNYLDTALTNRDEDARIIFIGDKEPLADDLKIKIDEIERETANCQAITIQIALNYGGRDEIVSACREIASSVKDGKINLENIDEALFSSYLYTKDIPDPDLIIRPSGEMRLSNFLIWQSAYSEFVFMDILWPDFSEKDLDEAIRIFSTRNRRFGGI